jgi:hypothetical protein
VNSVKQLEQRVEKLESEAEKVESARSVTAIMREVKEAYELSRSKSKSPRGASTTAMAA